MARSNEEVNYFKIGTFVLVGIGLIVFSLLILGSSKIFRPIVYVETYFEESIQGISEGTPVKYRGLQIGYVKAIAFTSEEYQSSNDSSKKDHSRSIYVKVAITSRLFTELSSEELKQFLAKEVAQGLRIKLVTQGLTGTSYLELDYVDPETSPPSTVSWQPKFFYLPSVPSTLTRLSENAQYIMNELKDVDFKQLFLDLTSLTHSLSGVAKKTESLFNQLNYPVVTTMQNLKVISDNFLTISNRIKLKPSAIMFGGAPRPLDQKKL